MVEDIAIAATATIFDAKIDLQPTDEETLGSILLDYLLLLDDIILPNLLLFVA